MSKAVEPLSKSIQDVIVATGCRSMQAKIYLQQYGNDVDKAINHLQAHSTAKKQRDQPASPTTSSPSSPAASLHTPSASPSRSSTGSNAKESATPLEGSGSSKLPYNKCPFDCPPPIHPSTKLNEKEEKAVHKIQDHSRSITPRSSRSSLQSLEVEQELVVESKLEVVMSQNESVAEAAPDSSTWDFRVPSLLPPITSQPGGLDGSEPFSIRDLLGSIQHGMSHDEVKSYLAYYHQSDSELLSRTINDTIEGFPAMFYVIAANDDANARVFAEHGGDINAIYGTPPVSLLAFAIINSKIVSRDTTAMVATLLSLGANASAIPEPFYSPFDEELPSDGPSDMSLKEVWEAEERLWCQPPHIRKIFTETINITQRYCLYRSSKLVKPTERKKWLAARNNSTDLFGVPYFLIGQSAAINLLTKKLLHYMLKQHDKPLVLVFAGPSGHGKTELARRLGELLSLQLQVSDCTIVSREVELFGPRKPYVGAEEGAPLNNFLAANNGRKCIVFLDEFEKTTADIWNALLIPFDKGEYQDRRSLKTINCSKTIWILATNALDKNIIEFCKSNEAIFDEKNLAKRDDLLEDLTLAMKENFISIFKPPLTGRIDAFVPFLPFSNSETYVGAHKYLLELTSEVRRPIDTKPGPQEQLLGNIHLKIRSDVSICKVVVKGYDPELGIRSLKNAVTDRVASPLEIEYLSMHEVISEDLPMEDYSIFVSDGKIRVKRIVIPKAL